MVDVGPPNGYVHAGRNCLRKVRAVGDLQMVYQATNMRQEHTGFHAKVEVFAEGTLLAYNTFNVERITERTALARSVYDQLRPAPKQELPSYPEKHCKNDIDLFCGGLRDAFLEGVMPCKMPGSSERHQPEFIARPYLLRDGGTILFAPPGQGKSYVLWCMAVCIDGGLRWLWDCQPTPVLVLNLERSPRSVADRLGNINQVLHLQRDRPLHVLNARGRTLEMIAPAVERYIEREGIGCVLLDSISRGGHGSLIDDDVVNGYCDLLNGFGVSWLALAHSPRPKNNEDTTHVFGSQMFDAAADLLVSLKSYTRMNGTMGISLDVTKRNDIGPQPLWIGSFAFDNAGLVEVRRARPGEFPALEDARELPPEDRVARYLLRVGEASATQVSRDTGVNRSVVSSMFNTSDRFVATQKQGRDQLYGLVDTRSVANVLRGTGSATHPGSQHISNTSESEELPF